MSLGLGFSHQAMIDLLLLRNTHIRVWSFLTAFRLARYLLCSCLGKRHQAPPPCNSKASWQIGQRAAQLQPLHKAAPALQASELHTCQIAKSITLYSQRQNIYRASLWSFPTESLFFFVAEYLSIHVSCIHIYLIPIQQTATNVIEAIWLALQLYRQKQVCSSDYIHIT